MTVDDRARTPLAHRLSDLSAVGERTGGGVILEHVPFLTQIDVRFASGSRRPGGAIVDLGTTRPEIPNMSERDGEREALWLGPDEWLVVAPAGEGIRLVAEMEWTLDGVPHSVVDVSANRVVLDIAGPTLLALLSKGCSLDLHPSRWPDGACAQTLLAQTNVILQHRDAAMRIFVRPSFADYLIDWLIDAAGP